MNADYGEPTELCHETSPGVFARDWTNAHVIMDCGKYEGSVTMKATSTASMTASTTPPTTTTTNTITTTTTTTTTATTTTTDPGKPPPAQPPAAAGGLPSYVYAIIAGGSLFLLGIIILAEALTNARSKITRLFRVTKHADADGDDDDGDDVPLVDFGKTKGHPAIYTTVGAESNLEAMNARVYAHQTIGVRSNI